MVDAFKTHSEMMSQQIEALRGQSTGDENGGAVEEINLAMWEFWLIHPVTRAVLGGCSQVNGITQGSMGG